MNSNLQQLLNKLASYKYGILYKDGAFVTDNDEIRRRDGTDIVVQTPQMMDRHRSGMCHDASIYVDQELTKMNIEHKCVYISSHVEPTLPTHSFVVIFNDAAKDWRIIDVFASNNCIYTTRMFKDLNQAIDMRTGCWIKDDNNGSANLSVFTLDHLPMGGCGFVEWTEKIVQKADLYNFDKGFVHISYNGIGIYEALKRAAKFEWKNLLKNEDISWLPKPDDYNGKFKSYFTMKGYNEFNEKVRPLLKKYLDESQVEEEYIEELDQNRIVYSDEFQIIIDTSIKFGKFNDEYDRLMNNLKQ